MASAFLDRVSNKAIGQLLIEKGTLTREQCDEALEAAKRDGVRLGEALITLGYTTREALGYALGEQFGVRPMELHPSMLDVSLVRRFPFELLRRHQILPLIEVDDELVVVVSDPNNSAGLEELATMYPSYHLSAQLAEEGQIRRCLESLAKVFRQTGGDFLTPALPPEILQSKYSIPEPADPSFANWLVAKALESLESDIVIRVIGNECQVCRRHFERAAGTAPVEKLHGFAATKFNAVYDGLIRQCTFLEYTDSHAARWSAPINYGGKVFDLLVTSYPATRTPLLQIRPLEHFAYNSRDAHEVKLSLTPGSCSIVFYRDRQQLEAFLGELLLIEEGRHLPLLLQSVARRCYDGHVWLPAYFANAENAVGASGATLVVFDYAPELSDVLRLIRSTVNPPAIVCCAPFLKSKGANGVSPDVENLVARLSAKLVYLNADVSPAPTASPISDDGVTT